MSDLIKALQILVKYADPHHPTCCEHDRLFVLIDPTIVSAEDVAALDALGFCADLGEKHFYSYRFGSA